jgi:peroxiredoxin
LENVCVGKAAPEFALSDQNGKMVSLTDFRGRQNVVLLFYPLDWTPV